MKNESFRNHFKTTEFYIAYLISILPFVLLITMIMKYYVDVPFWDQWLFIDTLKKYYNESLTLKHLWTQHNEHRLIFPRILMFLLARISGWNILYELISNICLAIGIFICIVYQTHLSLLQLDKIKTIWFIPVTSIIIFSLNQSTNWLWGWQLQIFLNVLAVVFGFIFLSKKDMTYFHFVLAIFGGIVATYSFANGLMYWVCGFIILLFTTNKKLFFLIAWFLASGTIYVSYLYQYQTPAHHPSIFIAFDQPLNFVLYCFAYLGRFVTCNNLVSAILAGVGGILLFIFCTIYLIKHYVDIHCLLPYIGFVLYAISSAFMTGIGRIGFGIEQALSPRYTTISLLLWLSITFLLYIVHKNMTLHHTIQSLNKFIKYIPMAILITLML